MYLLSRDAGSSMVGQAAAWSRVLRKTGSFPMPGLRVFHSLKAALDLGYQVYDTFSNGYLVRTRTAQGWALAIVDCQSKA